MSRHMQQLDSTTGTAARAAVSPVADRGSLAKISIILLLVLVLIPAVNGVTMIV